MPLASPRADRSASRPGGSRDRHAHRPRHPLVCPARPARGRRAAGPGSGCRSPPVPSPRRARGRGVRARPHRRSGRVADRTVTGALGWRGGDRLTLTASAGVVTARRDPAGLVTMPPRPCILIPAALRHRCGLLPGDPVLLTAVPAEDTLTAYSLAVVDQALRALIPFPAREGGEPMTITGPDARSAAPGQAVVDAAMLVLERMGLTPADLLAAPRRGRRPDLRRVHPGRLRPGQRRLPQGIRLVLEPGDRPVGQPRHRTSPRHRRSGSSSSTSGPRRARGGTPAAGAAPPSTSSPRCAACTSTPRKTA